MDPATIIVPLIADGGASTLAKFLDEVREELRARIVAEQEAAAMADVVGTARGVVAADKVAGAVSRRRK